MVAASRRTKVSEVAVTMCRWPSPGCRRGPLERLVMSIPHAMSSVVGVFCLTHCSSTIETRQAALQGDDDIASPSVDGYSLLGHKYHRSSCPDGAQVWFASKSHLLRIPAAVHLQKLGVGGHYKRSADTSSPYAPRFDMVDAKCALSRTSTTTNRSTIACLASDSL